MTEEQDFHWEEIAGKLHRELNIDEEGEFIREMDDRARQVEFEKAQVIHDQLAEIGLQLRQEIIHGKE